MKTRVLSQAEVLAAWSLRRDRYGDRYLAMYSSLLGGIVTDPALMLVPIDDHMVHRGDAVFEALKCVDGAIYQLEPHLDRLARSAAPIGLVPPLTRAEITEAILDSVRAAGRADCAIRLLISRGPGSFGVNPYDCAEPTIYVIVTALGPSFMELHPMGASVGVSDVPLKPSFFAGVKSCNYLPNVLMAREAVDAGLDFVVAFDHEGHLAEGATENVGIVSAEGALLFPHPGYVLRGTTMVRVMELAETLLSTGELSGIGYAAIDRDCIARAREVLVVGTTRNVTSVREFDGRAVCAEGPGPVARALTTLLDDDMRHGATMRTPVDMGSELGATSGL